MLPVGTKWWSINHVPISMYLLAYPYFVTYHNLSSVLLRRIRANGGHTKGKADGAAAPAMGWTLPNMCGVVTMAYTTAVLEAWSIGSFPGYWYPDKVAMLTKGSGFYSLFFIVSYPMFSQLTDKETAWSTTVSSMATGTMILMLYDAWRVTIGPISELVPTECMGHPVATAIDEI